MSDGVGNVIDVVKHGGKRPTESFSRGKLHNSINIACLSVKTPEGEATNFADTVSDAVVAWAQDKPEITSKDIQIKAHEQLERLHPEAAYMYKSHKAIM